MKQAKGKERGLARIGDIGFFVVGNLYLKTGWISFLFYFLPLLFAPPTDGGVEEATLKRCGDKVDLCRLLVCRLLPSVSPTMLHGCRADLAGSDSGGGATLSGSGLVSGRAVRSKGQILLQKCPSFRYVMNGCSTGLSCVLV